MNRRWEVELRIDGESVLMISPGGLTGDPDIAQYSEQVQEAAEHLMAFGASEESKCFYCGGEGEIETDNNGSIVPCSICSPCYTPGVINENL